jgi:hypothetical protein
MLKKIFVIAIIFCNSVSVFAQYDMKNMSVKDASKQENKELPKTIRYDLYVKDTVVNFTGKSKHAIAVNGSIPMPTLTFTEYRNIIALAWPFLAQPIRWRSKSHTDAYHGTHNTPV